MLVRDVASDQLPGSVGTIKKVYHAQLCHDFAHLYFKSVPSQINKDVSINGNANGFEADNYAWYATNLWLNQKSNWGRDPFKTAILARRAPQADDDTDDDNSAPMIIGANDRVPDVVWPRNCKYWGSMNQTEDCEFMGSEYDEYVGGLCNISFLLSKIGSLWSPRFAVTEIRLRFCSNL
ncbi:hypothetical protein LTR50_006240 [Elasticomyces elasticus]|nr:hypothetical protein LTR50_006240 [Elasticomyces elasticus]